MSTTARPCPCDRVRLGEPFDRGRDCRPCWLYHHDARYRELWDRPAAAGITRAAPAAAGPCVHLGDDPVPARHLVALGLSPIREYRPCAMGHGTHGLTCPCLSTCGPGKCPDYRASDGPAVG